MGDKISSVLNSFSAIVLQEKFDYWLNAFIVTVCLGFRFLEIWYMWCVPKCFFYLYFYIYSQVFHHRCIMYCIKWDKPGIESQAGYDFTTLCILRCLQHMSWQLDCGYSSWLQGRGKIWGKFDQWVGGYM